jgi:pimeloyl-ACP methyl ester carboxylesterase
VRVDEQTIEVAGAPVFFRSAPAGDIPTLYLHGIPTSSDDWTGLLERTGGLAPDLPGFGRSGKGGHLDYSVRGHADFVERFLEDRRVERITLVAHDWGAAAGLAFAERHPERVERIVLLAPVALFGGARWPAHARAWRRPGFGELAMGFTTRRVLARALRRASTTDAAWPDDRLTAVWEQFDQGTQRAILRLHRAAWRLLETAGVELARPEGIPTLIQLGDQDPWLAADAADAADAYATRFPQATVETIAGAGHWPWLDQPEVIGRVAAFLEEDR